MPIRIRQHVNPLARKFQQPITIPNWQEVLENPQQDIHLDIGCARGGFLLEMAQQHPEINFLGIEIRQPLVSAANQLKNELGIANLHYLFGNMNSSAEVLLKSFPGNALKTISVQFPDPWFKKRHNKRRVVQNELVRVLVNYLGEGGRVFLQSDIEEVAKEMRDRFTADSRLILQHTTTWLDANPFSVATERELYVLEQNLPVYRVMFYKSST
ncbi:tRNA (guanosine(46)-N7)-methyltransferase TrmB [Waterburya agarophytonicola K14]|uniref:tRNA (guanine-N(7)-)-methyltransferase n=1 Tax=Waterburya agarophytonicola KI4 TaxID=2874699 RepID=A0A964BL25_9CYAN|nr:tRNA (guanosine(46)-N7)-methyltransferase TrmB [Waterburya agarophytonicola]MCC0175365.1 tRNA (guanosine(46)-N7)-methyltransferase TrmB [Waterburya agarophytonicola KI4]